MNHMHDETSPAGGYRPRLVIYVVWHPGFERGQAIAEAIYTQFSRDPERPYMRALGIPVFYRSAVSSADQSLPAPIPVDEARHTAIITLVDAKMVLTPGWAEYVETLWRQVSGSSERHRLYPVAMSASAYQFSVQISEVNFIRLQHLAPESSLLPFLNQLTNELARLLTKRPAIAELNADPAPPPTAPERMQLFISHAKLDGEKPALALRDHIQKTLPLDTFFDAIDIAAGFRFEDQINQGIEHGALAVVQTDAYASRMWCQHEVIRAKRRGRPVVVIHCIEEGEARSFPYIGNVPTIRWRADEPARLDAVVGLVLREVLRSEYFHRHFDDLKELFHAPAAVRALPRAPELLTCLALRTESAQVPYFVYPDPPLAKQEAELLTELDPNLRLTTPTLLFAMPSEPVTFADQGLARAAAGWRIGLSVSDSPDLAARGLGSAHLRDAATEFARFFLAAGATLAYGGDLRQGGFTEVLFELLSTYRALTGETVDAVQSYLPWPLNLDLSEEQEAQLLRTARFHKVPAPADVGVDAAKIASAKDLPAGTPQNRVAWARSLSAMRQRMNTEIHARLLLGGQARGLGKYPGLAEEALLALRQKKPVYLLGGFGGCAEAVIQALCGETPKMLTHDFQSETPAAREAIAIYNAQLRSDDGQIDYPALVSEFQRIGIDGLNNGLSEAENRRLISSAHLPEMVALVLRGLSRLGAPPSPQK